MPTQESNSQALIAVDKTIHLQEKTWSFSTPGLASKFTSHIKRSIPSYLRGHELILGLSDYFVKKNSRVYDLGCSVGELTKKLQKRHLSKSVDFIGIDKVGEMIQEAKKDPSPCRFYCEDLSKLSFDKTSFSILYYTLQFMEQEERRKLLKKLYGSLEEDGALLIFEKVFEEEPYTQEILSSLYRSYKLEESFSPLEVLRKEESLRGVLKPLSRKENFKMFEEAGFKPNLIMKDLQFEGYLLRK